MKIRKKPLSLLLALCVMLTLIPFPTAAAESTEYTPTVMPGSVQFTATASFNTEYSLSGTSVDKMVAIAQAQVGRTTKMMGYTEAWCGHFISDVAARAGESAAIPYNAGCRWLYNAIIKAGGTDVSTPQRGDIVFFVCTRCTKNGYNNAYSHVGLMLDGSGTCISGNYTRNHVAQVAEHSVYDYSEPHSVASGDVILKYVRPNYKNPSAAAVKPEITLSRSSMSLRVGESSTVTIGTKSPGTIYLRAYTTNSSVCSGSWGPWNSAGTEKTLTLTGKTAGSTTITIRMYDGKTNQELTRKALSVSTASTPPAQTTDPKVSVETLKTLNRAGTASLYPTVFKGYLRGADKYDAYSDRSGTNHIGRIYSADELKVQSVYANNGALWISALCPWDGYSSDRQIYTKLDAVIDAGFAPYTAIATSSAAVYRRSDLSTKYGSLGAGDAVTVVGQSGQYSQVIYPLAAGGYKVGWCQTNALSRPNISAVSAKSASSVRLSLSLPANADNTLVVTNMNGKVLARSSVSKSSVSVGNVKSSVSYYFYIESKLANGTGTVSSEVKKITLT